MAESLSAPHRKIGVLGGMGPVSSAEFVRSVYDHCSSRSEQNFPALILHSDPATARRTPQTMDSADSAVLDRLVQGLRDLTQLGCEEIVLCCMTLHHLLPRVPEELSRGVVPVLDVAIEAMARTPGRHLVLCSEDSRALRLFERHPRWAEAAPFAIFAGASSDHALQEAINDIKVNRGPKRALAWIGRELAQSGATSVVAGCSEIHVLARRWGERIGVPVLDPFDLLARRAARGSLSAALETAIGTH